MIHTIKCTICNETKKVNGQKQIDSFGNDHSHNDPIARKHLELDKPQDEKPFNTGSNVATVHDYWRKVPGSM